MFGATASGSIRRTSRFAEQPRILPHEAAHPVDNEGIPSGSRVAPAHESHNDRPQGIDDQVVHCVVDAGFVALHVNARPNLIDRKLENFPENPHKDREGHAEKADKCRSNAFGQPIGLVQHEQRQETDDSEQEP